MRLDESNDKAIENALVFGFGIGMHQHVVELRDFLRWLASRPVDDGLGPVIEIGTLHGGTAAMWSKLTAGPIVTIDKPEGRFGGADHGLDLSACLRRSEFLRSISKSIHPVIGDSHDPAVFATVESILDGRKAGLLFIDGDHTLEGVRADHLDYSALVADGGIIAFHDVDETAVHEKAGCHVHRYWRELPEPKYVFSIGADWGGIGAIVKGATR